MTWESRTSLLIVAIVVGCILYDFVAYALGGNAATISRTCLNISDSYRGFAVCFAFAMGVLLGHLFVPQHR